LYSYYRVWRCAPKYGSIIRSSVTRCITCYCLMMVPWGLKHVAGKIKSNLRNIDWSSNHLLCWWITFDHIHTGELLIPDPSPFEVEIAITNLKRYNSPGSDQIPVELIQASQSEIHKLVNSIWNKEELPDQWKESISVWVHNKSDKTDSGNYCGISLIWTSFKILSSILLSRLSPYIEEMIGDK
jgi:hypothetical protein